MEPELYGPNHPMKHSANRRLEHCFLIVSGQVEVTVEVRCPAWPGPDSLETWLSAVQGSNDCASGLSPCSLIALVHVCQGPLCGGGDVQCQFVVDKKEGTFRNSVL